MPLLHVMVIASGDVDAGEVIQEFSESEAPLGDRYANNILNFLILITVAECVTVTADGAVIGIANNPQPSELHGIAISGLPLQVRLLEHVKPMRSPPSACRLENLEPREIPKHDCLGRTLSGPQDAIALHRVDQGLGPLV